MDKYDLLLDILEHPEKYSPDQIEDLLKDTEIRDLYNLISRTESAFHASKALDSVNIDSEWQRFESRCLNPKKPSRWFGTRAASMTVIVLSSLAAVAACITLTVAISDKSHNAPTIDTITVNQAPKVEPNTAIVPSTDSIASMDSPAIFENERLDKILSTIAEHFNTTVKFNNDDTASLHLYYKFDPSLSLNEVIEQLNTFEQINISTDGNTIIVD